MKPDNNPSIYGPMPKISYFFFLSLGVGYKFYWLECEISYGNIIATFRVRVISLIPLKLELIHLFLFQFVDTDITDGAFHS